MGAAPNIAQGLLAAVPLLLRVRPDLARLACRCGVCDAPIAEARRPLQVIGWTTEDDGVALAWLCDEHLREFAQQGYGSGPLTCAQVDVADAVLMTAAVQRDIADQQAVGDL
jgi:hypothetical protein